jgi:CheY-like chemotaxis protein
MTSALVVDDLQTGRTVLRAALEKRGWDVKTAANLAEALAIDPPPSLVVADLHLPDSRGLVTVDRLRRAYPAATLLFTSAASDEPELVQAMQAGGLVLHAKGPPLDWLPEAGMTDSIEAAFGPHWPTKLIAALAAAITALGWAYVGAQKQQLVDELGRLTVIVDRQQDTVNRQQEALHAIRTDLAIIAARLGRAEAR